MASSHENLVKFQWRGPEIVGKMLQFRQFCNFQKLAKVHRSQHPLRRGPLYLAQIFHNVCSFRPLFQICHILWYSKVIRLEGTEVSEKSRQNLQIFTSENVGNTDRAPSDLYYKISPHSKLVSWSLTSLFSTNMAISETKPHSNILAKIPQGSILRPWILECKKTK